MVVLGDETIVFRVPKESELKRSHGLFMLELDLDSAGGFNRVWPALVGLIRMLRDNDAVCGTRRWLQVG